MEKLDKVIAALERSADGDLISRSALMDVMGHSQGCGCSCADCEKINCLMGEAIEDAPAVEAEPVVRCEDCEYYVDAPYYVAGAEKGVKICRSPSLDFDTECGDQWMWMPPDGFCSNGVRRGEEVAE